MIRVVNLTQHYGVRPVLKNVSLEIPTGELVTILGPNGAGKSTLLAAMAGLLAPQEGYVEFDGVRRRSSPEGELAVRRQVAYLPDAPWLPLTRTGREFLMAVGGLYDRKPSHLMEHAERLLKLFNLTDQADWAMRSYSSGQHMKIALCGALITDPIPPRCRSTRARMALRWVSTSANWPNFMLELSSRANHSPIRSAIRA